MNYNKETNMPFVKLFDGVDVDEGEVEVCGVYEEEMAEAYAEEINSAVKILRTIPVELHTLIELVTDALTKDK